MALRLGTRGSALARAQATDVARRLEATGHIVTTEIITTIGDQVTDRSFAEVGTYGVFVREIESALMDGRIDLAVHSYKDLPSQGPESLVVAAVPERLDPADVLIARRDALESGRVIPVRAGARIGTASARRRALIHELGPDVTVEMLRGNVPTRLRALVSGQFDAIILAAAGLARLERAGEATDALSNPELVRARLDPHTFVPAPAQGAIAVQVRRDDGPTRAAVAAIDDPSTGAAIAAERAVMARAGAGCTVPLGAWCDVAANGQLTLTAILGSDDGLMNRATVSGTDPERLADAIWHRLGQGRPA